MKAKAKSKLWAFRYPVEHDKGGCYVLWRGAKPRKSSRGGWPNVRSREIFDKVRTHWLLRERDFEAIFPMYCLPLGGGPVLIRFADED